MVLKNNNVMGNKGFARKKNLTGKEQVCQGSEGTGTCVHCWWDCTTVQPLEGDVTVAEILSPGSPHDTATPPRSMRKEMTAGP